MASRIIRPSYHQNFARSAGESKYPNLWKGLVGAWVPALGVTGGTLFDQSPFKNHGTLTNMEAVDWVIGQNGYSLNLDGVDEHITIPYSEATNFSGGVFTIIAGIKTSATGGTIFGTSDVFSNWELALNHGTIGGAGNPGELSWFNGTGWVDSDSRYDDGIHHQAAITRDGINVNFYKDGVANGSSAQAVPKDSVVARQIGSRAGSSLFFTGPIDYLYVYNNRALLSNEIKFISDNPLAPFELADRPIGFVAPITVTGFPISYLHRNQFRHILGR